MKKSNQKISMEIDVTPEAAWKIIGAVTGVDKWLAPVTACRVEGNERFCSTEEGEFKEDILKVDHNSREFLYAIPVQHMIPVSNINGKMAVKNSTNSTAIVEWEWSFDVEDENEQIAKDAFSMIGNAGIKGIEELIKSEVPA